MSDQMKIEEMNDDISFLVDGTRESIDNVTMLTTEGNE
jgi:hypothetical protein